MTDDQGYGVSSTFGGVIPTPAMDRIAKAGLRYTQFHSTALCSPTRAALITGRNHHSVGFGVIGELSTGLSRLRFRHRRRRMPPSARSSRTTATPPRGLARTTTRPAFNTAWRGPSINGRSAWASSISTASWAARPTNGRPICFANTPRSFPWIGKPDYNLTTDLADEAIKYMSELNAAAPDKPFFLYYVPGGTPLAAPADQGMDREVQRQVRHGLREAARTDLRQPEAARRDPGGYATHPVAGRAGRVWRRQAAAVGLAVAGAEETLCPPGGGLCRLHGLYRP